MIVSLSPQQENMDVAHEFCEGSDDILNNSTETCSDRQMREREKEEGRDGSRPKQRNKQPCACSAAVEETSQPMIPQPQCYNTKLQLQQLET